MSKYKAQSDFKSEDIKNEFVVEILTYYEADEKLYYAISLSLDIVGAGETEQNAVDNFNAMLEDFVKYTCNRGTIANELIRMGWDVTKKGTSSFKAKAPTIDELKNNPDWADIWAKNPQIASRKVELAL